MKNYRVQMDTLRIAVIVANGQGMRCEGGVGRT